MYSFNRFSFEVTETATNSVVPKRFSIGGGTYSPAGTGLVTIRGRFGGWSLIKDKKKIEIKERWLASSSRVVDCGPLRFHVQVDDSLVFESKADAVDPTVAIIGFYAFLSVQTEDG